MKTIGIIGGTGNTGRKLATLLLKYTSCRVVVGARKEDILERTVTRLKKDFPNRDLDGRSVDVYHEKSRIHYIESVDMVVVASGTADIADEVVQTCLDLKKDYLDIHYSNSRLRKLETMRSSIETSQSLVITEAGYHPGLPSAMIRHAARHLPGLKSAFIGGVLNVDWNSLSIEKSTVDEFAREMMDFSMKFYENSQWKNGSMWTTRDFKSMDFGEPLGKKTMSPMYFEELEAIPKMIPSLVNTGFYIAGTHWFSDMIIMPIVFLGLKLFPQKGLSLFGKLLFWSWGRFTTPPYRVILQMEAESDTEKKTVQLSHEDGYWFTAIPVAACLIQYINKMLPTSGYHYMGHIVDTEHLMTTMKSMGIVIKETNN